MVSCICKVATCGERVRQRTELLITNTPLKRLAFLLSATMFALGQQPTTSPIQQSETIIVTGTFEPLPLEESNRAVNSFYVVKSSDLTMSFVDYLHQDSCVDLQQREVDGVQADLSIRGASFGQTLVLLNGLRINDAETGHHNLDIPLPLEALDRIEVLHGAGSTLYGADALGGAVNFITDKPIETELRLRAAAGNFGINEQRILGAFSGAQFSERIAASRDASSGFQTDRDYRSSSASSETWLHSAMGSTDILLAGSDRPFGANQFYGNFPSWERTKSWFASLNQQIGLNTSVAFGYRRHSDVFVLIRDQPGVYENNHVSQSWQLALRRTNELGKNTVLAYGAEGDRDQIDSNNLGNHARNRGAGYINVDVRQVRRLSLSLGGREDILEHGRAEFSPTIAGAAWLRSELKMRASASRAFRLPTYTDLYYSDPANIGNPLLRPETAWSFEGGPEWNHKGVVSLQSTFFRRQDHNDIDYIRSSPSDPWRAANVQRVTFDGIETALALTTANHSETLRVGYTILQASQQLFPGMSKYVFNYPYHQAAFTWSSQFLGQMSLLSRLGVVQRAGTAPYAVWDLAASRSKGGFRPFIQLYNLSSSRYLEIPGVDMPGRSVVAGIELVFDQPHHH